MKKILLTILIIILIFSMNVIAIEIDVGNSAINRSGERASGITWVDKNNPANDTGIITSVEIYAETAMTLCEVAIFTASGNVLTTRSNVAIGNVALGYNQFDVELDVTAGDYIGFYFSTGEGSRAYTGDGNWWYGGDNIPCTSVFFNSEGNTTISLYGTGTTEVGWTHKWDTLTIGKWNTKEFTKWNGLE